MVKTGRNAVVVDGEEVEVRHRAGERLRVDGVVVVLLEPPHGVDVHNVVGISTDGERLWEIDAVDAGPDPDADPRDRMYADLYERDGEVYVVTRGGHERRIDVHTGELLAVDG